MKIFDKDTPLWFQLVGTSYEANIRLRAGHSLDRETRGSYGLTIVAKDGGLPANIVSATLQITILDANDNTPVFEYQNIEVCSMKILFLY